MHCLHRIYWGNRSACCHPNRPFLPLPPPALVLRCHAPRSFLSSLPVSLSFSSQEKPIIFLLVPNAYKSVTVAPTLVHLTKWLCRPVSDIYFFDCPDVAAMLESRRRNASLFAVRHIDAGRKQRHCMRAHLVITNLFFRGGTSVSLLK